MRLVLSALWIAFFALLGSARTASADSALSAAIDGAWREPQSRARDAFRHPYESLTFWGLKPGMTLLKWIRAARECGSDSAVASAASRSG
jgi:predicted methyltransferase